MNNETVNADELARLTEAASVLSAAAQANNSPASSDSEEIVERLRQGRFDVAVVGEFNRGKSTLINRLVNEMVLPSGALPVTSIVTELTHGEQGAIVRFADGSDAVIDLAEIERYVTEESNPGNSKKVDAVQISLPSPILRNGAVLIDTPGVGSVFRHNTDAAREVILRADGAIMVLSADTPITDAERALIKLLSKRSQKTFFVLNRIDHIEDDQRDRVEWFVTSVLREAFNQTQGLYSLSSKTGEGFEAFTKDFQEFITDGLEEARLNLARQDIISLADRIDNECAIEDSALAMSEAELRDKVSQFQKASDWQRESFGDDHILFSHAVERIVGDLKDKLQAFDRKDHEVRTQLEELTASMSASEASKVIDEELPKCVQATLDPIREQQESRLERSWQQATDRFVRATERRAVKLSDIAGELFSVTLNSPPSRAALSKETRFAYALAANAAPMGWSDKLKLALRGSKQKRAAIIDNAMKRYNAELDAHVDKLLTDMTASINQAGEELEKLMQERVEMVGGAMALAIERAHSAKTAAESERATHATRSTQLREASMLAREAAVNADA